MPRFARIVAPGVPHLVTQRTHLNVAAFSVSDGFALYRTLLAETCAAAGVEVWAYCLMYDHVHLIVVPPDARSLRLAIGEADRRYARHRRRDLIGPGRLWQGRFASVALDETALLACTRYVELSPHRAGRVDDAADWRWSSARAHLDRRDDALVRVAPLLDRVHHWRDFLALGLTESECEAIRLRERSGRPLGSAAFLAGLEQQLGRALLPRRPGPRPAPGLVAELRCPPNSVAAPEGGPKTRPGAQALDPLEV
jgi:putative transposase